MMTSSRSDTAFVSIAVLLVASLAIIYVIGLTVIHANRRVRAEQNVLEHLHETLSTVKDAETGQRGYVLTGDEAYLLPYQNAQRRLADEVNSLRRDAERAELDGAQFDDLIDTIGKKMAELEKSVGVRREKGFDAALKGVEANGGKRYMDSIRSQIATMATNQRQAIATESDRASNWEVVRTGVFTLLTLIDLAFIWWMYRRLQAESAAKELAALDVLRQKNLLGVTLSSIGDAVIVTDVEAKIVFMNAIAEQLTGWTDGSATGRPCADVFRIINEHSREPVESPVDKVLATGAIVGLANHTLLIRRDGSELPIDDSGSPVRDSAGQTHGVVLIFRDFSLQRDANNNLVKAMADLEAANKSKDRFVAMISHELRTPLTPVLGTLTRWELDQTLPTNLRDDVKMLRWNVELEARLIDDLLDLTRINSGKLSLKLATADVHQYVRSTLTIFSREIEEKQLRIDLALDAEQHFIVCDCARLQQVFWNVLKNASKFTTKGGTIRIATVNADGRILIKFIDNGIGMSPETLSRIFRPFEQGNPHITQHFGGLGLGLTISKELTEAHHGTLSAASDGLGQGSTFTVTLPLVDNTVPASSSVSPVPATDNKPRALKVLLVEDHVDTATVISLLLKKFGHTTETASTVADGITRFGNGAYDILLSDLGLPDGTGLDLIRQIREKSQIPAIALTGYGMDEDVARCKAAGFNAHLTKPINFQELEALIRKLT